VSLSFLKVQLRTA